MLKVVEPKQQQMQALMVQVWLTTTAQNMINHSFTSSMYASISDQLLTWWYWHCPKHDPCFANQTTHYHGQFIQSFLARHAVLIKLFHLLLIWTCPQVDSQHWAIALTNAHHSIDIATSTWCWKVSVYIALLLISLSDNIVSFLCPNADITAGRQPCKQAFMYIRGSFLVLHLPRTY